MWTYLPRSLCALCTRLLRHVDGDCQPDSYGDWEDSTGTNSFWLDNDEQNTASTAEAVASNAVPAARTGTIADRQVLVRQERKYCTTWQPTNAIVCTIIPGFRCCAYLLLLRWLDCAHFTNLFATTFLGTNAVLAVCNCCCSSCYVEASGRNCSSRLQTICDRLPILC